MKLGMRELLFVLIMIGLVCSAYFFVFKKLDARKQTLEAETMAKQKELSELRQAMSGIDDVNRKIDELQEAILFFESKLPQEKEIDKILKEVWQIAEANALETKTIKTLKTERSAAYSEQPIELKLSGDFRGFYSFLLQLEKLPRITRVTQMDLEKITTREGEMQATMTLSIFFEPDTGARSLASTN